VLPPPSTRRRRAWHRTSRCWKTDPPALRRSAQVTGHTIRGVARQMVRARRAVQAHRHEGR
jgi:hypothetical protein